MKLSQKEQTAILTPTCKRKCHFCSEREEEHYRCNNSNCECEIKKVIVKMPRIKKGGRNVF